ncbi:MAG: type III pantothenate kinase [Spirochaetales bacterium]|nr:type III pantothenate kinase [Spirochaetales bacterium]
MMMLLDVGNTRLSGSLFRDNVSLCQFSCPTGDINNSRDLRLFLEKNFRKNRIEPAEINSVSCSSVVPALHSCLYEGCLNFLGVVPFFLDGTMETGLNLMVENREKLGPDRIAAAAGAKECFPGENLIVADFGTATTVDCVNDKGDFLGGVILPGFNTAQESLRKNTARLPGIQIKKPARYCGRNTEEALCSGIYLMQLGAVKEGVIRMSKEHFFKTSPLIIGTGGFSSLFQGEELFDHIIPELIFKGIYRIGTMNRRNEKCK